MNILFVNPAPIFPHKGGIQRVTDILARELIGMGNNVYFISSRNKVDNGWQTCAPQYYLPLEEVEKKECVQRYHKLLERLNPDCIIFQWVDRNVEIYLESTPNNIKVISVVHQQPFAGYGYETLMLRNISNEGIDLRHRLFRFIGRHIPWPLRYKMVKGEKRHLAMLMQHSDRVCLLSEKFIPRVERFYDGIDSSKIMAISNPSSFMKEDLDMEAKDNTVIWVGRVNNFHKNVFDFVDVWEKIAKRHVNWNAIVVGDGLELKMLKAYAFGKSIQRIEFVGESNNVTEYYKKAKIQLVTSFCEGFSMVMLEGMSYGVVPVVYGTFESVEDIVDEEVNGFIAKPLDKEDMVRQVERLIDDPSLLSRLSKQGLRKIEKFDPRKIAEKWITLINSIQK